MEIATDAGWTRRAREASERADTATNLAQELGKQHAHGLVIALAVGWITANEAAAAAESLLKIDLRVSGATYPEDRFAALQELQAWSVAAVQENLKTKTESESKRAFWKSGAVFLTGTVRPESLNIPDTDNVEVTLRLIVGEKRPETRSVPKADIVIEPEVSEAELHIPERVTRGMPVFHRRGSFGVVCTAADPPNHHRVLVLWHKGDYEYCNLTDLRVAGTEEKSHPAPGVEAAALGDFESGDFVFARVGWNEWLPARVVSKQSSDFRKVILPAGQVLTRRTDALLPMYDKRWDTRTPPSFEAFKRGDRVFDTLGRTGVVIADAAEAPMWTDRGQYVVTWVMPSTGRTETVTYSHAELAGYSRVVAKSAPLTYSDPAPIPWACRTPPSVNDRVFVWRGHGSFSASDVLETQDTGIRVVEVGDGEDDDVFTDWRNCIRAPRREEGRLETVAIATLEEGDIVYGNGADPDEPGIVTGIIRHDNSQDISCLYVLWSGGGSHCGWRNGVKASWKEGNLILQETVTRSVPIGWVEKRVR